MPHGWGAETIHGPHNQLWRLIKALYLNHCLFMSKVQSWWDCVIGLSYWHHNAKPSSAQTFSTVKPTAFIPAYFCLATLMKESRFCHYDHALHSQGTGGVGEQWHQAHTNYTSAAQGDNAEEKSKPRVSQDQWAWAARVTACSCSVQKQHSYELPSNPADLIHNPDSLLQTVKPWLHSRTLLTPPLTAAGHILHKLLSDQATLKCTPSYKCLESSNGLVASRAVATVQSFISDSLGLKTWGNLLSLYNLFPAYEPDSQFCSTTWNKTVESFARTRENKIHETYSSGLSDG